MAFWNRERWPSRIEALAGLRWSSGRRHHSSPPNRLYSLYCLVADIVLMYWVVSCVGIMITGYGRLKVDQLSIAFFAGINALQGIFLSYFLALRRAKLDVVVRDRGVSPFWWICPALLMVEAVPGAGWGLAPIGQGAASRRLAAPTWLPGNADPLAWPQFHFLALLQAAGGFFASTRSAAFHFLLLDSGSLLVQRNVRLRQTLAKALGSGPRFRAWIRDHQDTIMVGQTFQELFSLPLLVHFFFQMVIICTSAFGYSKGELGVAEMSTSATYVLAQSIKLFVICRMGDHIAYESDIVTVEGFSSDWYSKPRRVKKMLAIVMTRASNNLTISTLFNYPLTSETFRSIIITAYSYYTVLDQLKRG